jgi:hypothetical protein
MEAAADGGRERVRTGNASGMEPAVGAGAAGEPGDLWRTKRAGSAICVGRIPVRFETPPQLPDQRGRT